MLESDAAYSETLWKGVARARLARHGDSRGVRRRRLRPPRARGDRRGARPRAGADSVLVERLPGHRGAAARRHRRRRSSSTCRGSRRGECDRHASRTPRSPASTGAAGIATTFSNGKLSGTKVPVADGDVAHFAVVTAKAGKRRRAGARRPDRPRRAAARAVRSIDPSRSLATLRFDGAPAQLLGDAATGWAACRQLLDRAAVLMAFEQLGGATRAFEITREYTLGRYAFGRPIASFQAHQAPPGRPLRRDRAGALELLLRRLGARATTRPSSASPRAARAPAPRDAFELASKEMIQLHGGVGYTWEFDCHLFYRRAEVARRRARQRQPVARAADPAAGSDSDR